MLDLFREYRADQASLRTAFELPASEEWLDRKQTLTKRGGPGWKSCDVEPLDARNGAEYLLLRSEVQGDLDDIALCPEAACRDRAAGAFPRHDRRA